MSKVDYWGPRSGGNCGYCNGYGKYNNSMGAEILTCSDYQGLMDQGWRRCAKMCYKFQMDKTCCPAYTIKCDAVNFELSKSQKKILKKFRNFVINGKNNDMSEKNKKHHDENFNYNEQVQVQVDPRPQKSLVKPGLGPDPTKPKARKKKEIRKEKALLSRQENFEQIPEKVKDLNLTPTVDHDMNSESLTLEKLTSMEFPADSKHKFEIRIVNAQTSDEEFMKSHKESYNVYKKYQMTIHNDTEWQCSRHQYTNFLCNSSLVPGKNNSGKYRFGSFHQQYLLDGKIFAVGVIDILPSSISSVYLYYDPDFAFLSPGTLTALFEIAFTRKLQNEEFPKLKDYYMGFYIHSCPKMRYKGQYHPSYLLCPVTYQWIPIKDALPKLEKSKFSRLNSRENSAEKVKVNVDKVLVSYQNEQMAFKKCNRKLRNNFKLEVTEYAKLVGSDLSQKMLLSLD